MKWFPFIGYIVFFTKFLNTLTCTTPSFNNLTVQSNFDLTKFLGIWYEIKWLPRDVHNASDIWLNFYQSFQLESGSTQRLVVPGRARVLNNDTCFDIAPWSIIANNSAKMILEKQDMSVSKPLNWPYYVLKTDYEHYALIYSCTSENYVYTNPCPAPVFWVFSRDTSLESDDSDELDVYIQNLLCVNLASLEITPQDGKQCYSSSTIPIFDRIFFLFLFFLYI